MSPVPCHPPRWQIQPAPGEKAELDYVKKGCRSALIHNPSASTKKLFPRKQQPTMQQSEKRLFPDTYSKIRRAKREGLTAEQVWEAMKLGVSQSGMQPSAAAASLGIYREYLEEIYGVAAARKAVAQ